MIILNKGAPQSCKMSHYYTPYKLTTARLNPAIPFYKFADDTTSVGWILFCTMLMNLCMVWFAWIERKTKFSLYPSTCDNNNSDYF